jgi:GTP diphosphokinase / guanosine-3',5'-bis(diphosphate) 3'-diphosphatase
MMNVARLLAALEFAAVKHRAQRRKSGDDTPYINHPIQVARLLAEVGGVTDEDVLIAAVLHDTLEDTATTREELLAAFGPVVLRLVEEVTDDKSLPKAERKRLQIAHASSRSAGAAAIKLADKIANVGDLSQSPPPDWSSARLGEYVAWAEEVVRNLPKVNSALETRFAEVARDARHAIDARSLSPAGGPERALPAAARAQGGK